MKSSFKRRIKKFEDLLNHELEPLVIWEEDGLYSVDGEKLNEEQFVEWEKTIPNDILIVGWETTDDL